MKLRARRGTTQYETQRAVAMAIAATHAIHVDCRNPESE
jgi:hypothetical protein